MPEAIIIILDNSDYSINGDYEPTRWLSQIDAAGLLIQAKLQQHHENCMGIALSAGKHAEIICTPSNDINKVTSFLYGIKQHGKQQLSVALQTSALALKHRSNPNLTQRIVCFIASTINQSPEQLKLICKKLKKNNISLDLIALGDLSNKQKETLTSMNESIKTDKACELIFVEPERSVSDALFSSSILGGGGGEQGIGQMINEADDPDLAMALQLSLQQAEAAAARRNAQPNPAGNMEDQLEQRALQLAMQEQKGQKKQEKKEEEDKEDKKQE